ncbi:hypothetical protein SAMN05444920_12131 [Nonomuraea solani]|uniref:Uncharacterized protein n=1 Tax=Nonomuraea solani TaxID=1144553 RepID=A0A1H6EVY7_9ACTN|nr:hypothetical protein [Nonomuraea solani]SEH01583.1 hypothetical protein SAMN05444920_12131 [Nonomuraea solani]
MQFIETSVVGMRSAVITLRRPLTRMAFKLFPMPHIAEPAFHGEVAERPRECHLIAAEGSATRYAPAHWLVARLRTGASADQPVALDLGLPEGEPLGYRPAGADWVTVGRS